MANQGSDASLVRSTQPAYGSVVIGGMGIGGIRGTSTRHTVFSLTAPMSSTARHGFCYPLSPLHATLYHI